MTAQGLGVSFLADRDGITCTIGADGEFTRGWGPSPSSALNDASRAWLEDDGGESDAQGDD